MKTIAFFHHLGGAGTTTLVHHLAWMFADLGLKVVLLDLDPRMDLTSSFLADDDLEALFLQEPAPTIAGAIPPWMAPAGAPAESQVFQLADRLWLVPGDPLLADREEGLGEAWAACVDEAPSKRERGLQVTTALAHVARRAAQSRGADLVLLDLGAGLSALNRAALVASDAVVLPVGADLASLRSWVSIGPKLRAWRKEWQLRHGLHPDPPTGDMRPVGYVAVLPALRRAPQELWLHRHAEAYARHVSGNLARPEGGAEEDPHRLAVIRNHLSLMPLAKEAHKPVFHLTPRDGALGALGLAVARARTEFETLARRIAHASDLELPPGSGVR